MRAWLTSGLFRRLAAVALSALSAGCGGPTELDVTEAWVRLPAAPGRPAAAYFTVRGGASPTTLHRVTANYALRAEMHESMAGHHGAMSMRAVRSVPVPAGREVRFEPGGLHVMLFDLDARAKPGGTTMLTLAFDGNRRLYRKAWIVGAGQDAPH